MEEKQNEQRLRGLLNPFLNVKDTSDVITGHVSGRRTDIAEIIMSGQSAIILAGAPSIGKSALIRYLRRSPNEWSWRDELRGLGDQLNLNEIHFTQIDLTPLEGIENPKELLSRFVEQFCLALNRTYKRDGQSSSDLKALRELLRTISREIPNGRCFVMLDSIEHLGRPGTQSFPLNSKAQTAQERGLALLDHCTAIRTLVDLIDEFNNFGVILAIESPPRPKISDQFTLVSADLARFTTMTLQIFTWEDAGEYVAQVPESFGIYWAERFKVLNSNYIFSKEEQDWLLEQAGTHPYLLHQFYFRTFDLKQKYASICGTWTDLQESGKRQLTEIFNERLNTFLVSTWRRLQEAISKSSPETKSSFDDFVNLLRANPSAEKKIDLAFWEQLGPELRYILLNEGIVRFDPFQPIHYPGSILRNYFVQKTNEASLQAITSAVSLISGHALIMNRPGSQSDRLSLSELEYRLLKTLLDHPERCKDEELMKGAWGRIIERPTFTQRIFQLRKKLKDHFGGIEIIENHYGGLYSLNHPEWFHLE